MSYKKTDHAVIMRAQRGEQYGNKPKGLVTIGDSVYHIERTSAGPLKPHKITTIKEYEQHFGLTPGYSTIEEALANR